MSEILSTRDINDLLRIIECDSEKEMKRRLFLFSLRTRLRRIICFLLRKKDDTPSDEFFRYLSDPVQSQSGPARIYPYRVK